MRKANDWTVLASCLFYVDDAFSDLDMVFYCCMWLGSNRDGSQLMPCKILDLMRAASGAWVCFSLLEPLPSDTPFRL